MSGIALAFTANDIEVAAKSNPDLRRSLPERLAEALQHHEGSFRHKVGKALSAHKDTPFGKDNLCLKEAGVARKGGLEWRLAWDEAQEASNS